MLHEQFELFNEDDMLFESSQIDFSKMLLKYKVIDENPQEEQFRSTDGALTFLVSLSNVEYAILYKKGTVDYKDLMGIKLWYSLDDSDNYINNLYKSNIKEFQKNILDNTRVHKL